jgi:hypothetical protein
MSSHTLPWRRVFIRAGIRFDERGTGAFSFRTEPPDNLAFIKRILECVQPDVPLIEVDFAPPEPLVDEGRWLECWERLGGGAEAGRVGFEHIEIGIMDPYLSGVVRWLNALGVTTFLSCDGHNRRGPYIDVASGDSERVAELVRWASSGRMRFDGRRILRAGEARRSSRRPWPERRELLDLAERLFERFEEESTRA